LIGKLFENFVPLFDLAKQCAGLRTVPGLQSNTANEPIVLRTSEQCADVVEYERQFMFQSDGSFRPRYYFSPDLPEDPTTIAGRTVAG
jgi:hypothetical protein